MGCETCTIRKKHAKNSYRIVCNHTLSKNGIISYQKIDISYPYYLIPTIVTHVISYLRQSVSYVQVLIIHTCTCHYILVLFHTKTCHFTPATTCFIRIRNVSYVQVLFHTFENLFHIYRYCFICAHVISSYHTYIYCFIPTHVISYLRQPVSYVNVLFHTYTRDFR